MKLLLSTIFLIFIQANTQAGNLKYFSELANCENFNEVQTIVSVDSFSVTGGGNFVWIPNDFRPGCWGLRSKSAQSGKAGSWVRQDISSIHPDWFGARHLQKTLGGEAPTFRNLGYSEATIKERYSSFIPDISLDDTPDWAALQLLFHAMETGYYSANLGPADYYINRTIQLPEITRKTDNTIFLIEGGGCTISSTNFDGYAFFETLPSNQRIGLDIFTTRRFTISNIIFRGNALPGKGAVGIRIGATFHSLFENIHFADLDTGIVLRHAMSTEIYRCNAVNIYSICYYLGSGTGVWPGANAPNSGSNQSRVIASRMFVAPGQYAGVYISNSSECRVDDFTVDGGMERNTSYVIYINTGGTTTVKDGYVKGIHGEAAVDSALVKFRGSGNALFDVSDLFVQMKCTLVELEATNGYAQVNCSNFTYFPDGSQFANKGEGGAWHLVNVLERNSEIKWKTSSGYQLPKPERLRIVKKLM